jgi:C-terminal processing protease CtpA/Prc
VRGTGISFRKMPAYWRVVGVVPGSPAASAGVAPGDLVSKVNGEAIASWDPARYDAAIAGQASLEYTFIEGSSESNRTLRVVDIVP